MQAQVMQICRWVAEGAYWTGQVNDYLLKRFRASTSSFKRIDGS
jgi:hypothetical protein